jgi:hypothetical protein
MKKCPTNKHIEKDKNNYMLTTPNNLKLALPKEKGLDFVRYLRNKLYMKTKDQILNEVIEANNKMTLEMAKELQLLRQEVEILKYNLAKAEGEIKNLNNK